MPTAHYHYGQNIPGYLPMADEPNIAEDFDSAKRCLISDMDRVADQEAMAEDGEAYAEEISAAMEDVNLWSQPDAIHVSDPKREHDLGLAFWIAEPCYQAECMEHTDR